MGGRYSRTYEDKRRYQEWIHTVTVIYGFTKEWNFLHWVSFFFMRRSLKRAEKIQAVTDRLAGKKNG